MVRGLRILRGSAAALTLTALGTLAVAACGETAGPAGATTVLSIAPTSGSTDADPNAPVVVRFSGPMQVGMEQYAALHVGDVSGPVVAGTWMWSDDRTQLTFAPDSSLEPGMRYAVHLGGGMEDAGGNTLDYQDCIQQLGGQWVTQSMLGGSMMGGGTNMMGTGWQGTDGTYGMVFFFTTAKVTA